MLIQFSAWLAVWPWASIWPLLTQFPLLKNRSWTDTRWSLGLLSFHTGSHKTFYNMNGLWPQTGKKSGGQKRSISTMSSIRKPPRCQGPSCKTQNIKVIPYMAEVRSWTILGKSTILLCLTQLLLDEHDFISEHELSSPETWPSSSVYKRFEGIDEDPSLWTTEPSIQLFSTSLDQISEKKKLELSALECQLQSSSGGNRKLWIYVQVIPANGENIQKGPSKSCRYSESEPRGTRAPSPESATELSSHNYLIFFCPEDRGGPSLGEDASCLYLPGVNSPKSSVRLNSKWEQEMAPVVCTEINCVFLLWFSESTRWVVYSSKVISRVLCSLSPSRANRS